jgi:hypothetical protein
MTTERTRLSASTLDLFTAVTVLGPAFQPLLHFYTPTLVRLLGRTNKLYVARASACLSAIIQNTRLSQILPYIEEGMHDKAASTRFGCVEALALCFVHVEKAALERKHISQIDEMIRRGATDKEVKTRELARQTWETYKKMWPDRVDASVS